MAGPQWENLPEPTPDRPVPSLRAGWQGFTVDPRSPANQGLRAADADRDYATRLVEQARLDGRLSPAEADDRAARASGSRTLGELLPLVGDLMAVSTDASFAHRDRGHRFMRGGAMGWVGLALLFNAIWIMTSLSAGRPAYYWPMWPLFFMGLPLVMPVRQPWPEPAAAPGPAPPAPAGRRPALNRSELDSPELDRRCRVPQFGGIRL